MYKSTHFNKYFVKAQKIQSETIIKIHVKKKRRNSDKCSFYVRSKFHDHLCITIHELVMIFMICVCICVKNLLTYNMYSKVISIVRVDQQETAVWIIRLTLGLGFYCIKLSGIKFVADAVVTVPAVADCTKYTA